MQPENFKYKLISNFYKVSYIEMILFQKKIKATRKRSQSADPFTIYFLSSKTEMKY